jgi:hypothetical protein
MFLLRLAFVIRPKLPAMEVALTVLTGSSAGLLEVATRKIIQMSIIASKEAHARMGFAIQT